MKNMKSTNSRIDTAIEKNELKELFTEIKETIATGNLKNNVPASTFAMVDLWRVQKKKKTLGSSTKW